MRLPEGVRRRQQNALVLRMLGAQDPAVFLDAAQQDLGGLRRDHAGPGQPCAGDSGLVLQLRQHMQLRGRHSAGAQFFVQPLAKKLEQPLDQ